MVKKETNGSHSTNDSYKAEKQQFHIQKLIFALKKCGKAIKKLEEQEMSLDDLEDEDSNYIKLDRYKRRYLTLEKKIAELKREKFSLGRNCDKKFKTEASRIPEVNSKIQDLVNRQRKFPDFHDIIKAYKDYHEEKNLTVSSNQISNMGK